MACSIFYMNTYICKINFWKYNFWVNGYVSFNWDWNCRITVWAVETVFIFTNRNLFMDPLAKTVYYQLFWFCFNLIGEKLNFHIVFICTYIIMKLNTFFTFKNHLNFIFCQLFIFFIQFSIKLCSLYTYVRKIGLLFML